VLALLFVHLYNYVTDRLIKCVAATPNDDDALHSASAAKVQPACESDMCAHKKVTRGYSHKLKLHYFDL